MNFGVCLLITTMRTPQLVILFIFIYQAATCPNFILHQSQIKQTICRVNVFLQHANLAQRLSISGKPVELKHLNCTVKAEVTNLRNGLDPLQFHCSTHDDFSANPTCINPFDNNGQVTFETQCRVGFFTLVIAYSTTLASWRNIQKASLCFGQPETRIGLRIKESC